MNKIFKIGAAVAAITAVSAIAYKFLKKNTEDECTCECNDCTCNNDDCFECDGECECTCACHAGSVTDTEHDSDTDMQDTNEEVVCEETQKDDTTETEAPVEHQDSEKKENHSAETE